MDRGEYNACITPYMQGTGKTKEQRQLDMCIGAKLCSGKSASPAEAEQTCLNQPSKEPKPRKSKSCKCIIDAASLACVAKNIELNGLTTDNLYIRLEAAINNCNATKTASAPTYKRFMNACLKETGGGGDFLSSQSDIKNCQIKWNKYKGVQA